MRTLGLDTATADTAVAVVDGDETLAELRVGPGPDGRPAHGRSLLEATERVIAEAGGWDGIELIAAGIGPGSFTGVRIGIATARGLARGRGLPLAGVGSTAALLAGLAERRGGAGRPRIAVVDARRGEVFVAIDRGEGASEPIVAAPAELASVIGGAEGSLACGDGSVRFRSEVEAAGAEVPPDGDPAHRLSARQTCLLGARATPRDPGEVEPLYLRRPDAERWLERDGRN